MCMPSSVCGHEPSSPARTRRTPRRSSKVRGNPRSQAEHSLALLSVVGAVGFVGTAAPADGATEPTTQCAPTAHHTAATTPVAFWSTEARCAIVPPGPAGGFGPENFGNKFPGKAAVYMGIVHVAIY